MNMQKVYLAVGLSDEDGDVWLGFFTSKSKANAKGKTWVKDTKQFLLKHEAGCSTLAELIAAVDYDVEEIKLDGEYDVNKYLYARG